MSLAAGPVRRPKPTTAPAPERRLRVVNPASRVPRLPYLVLTSGAIVGGVLGLLSLNVSVNQQAFTIASLERSNRAAEARYASLQAQVDVLKSPERIARAAAAAHLVPAGRPHVTAWPGQRPGQGSQPQTSPGAATSPAALGAGPSGSAWSTQEPFPLKRYLAEP
jgi:hypothetical protein